MGWNEDQARENGTPYDLYVQPVEELDRAVVESEETGFAKVLDANLKMFSSDGKMPSDGPQNVLETLKAADTQTDWSKVDLSKTFTNDLVAAVR